MQFEVVKSDSVKPKFRVKAEFQEIINEINALSKGETLRLTPGEEGATKLRNRLAPKITKWSREGHIPVSDIFVTADDHVAICPDFDTDDQNAIKYEPDSTPSVNPVNAKIVRVTLEKLVWGSTLTCELAMASHVQLEADLNDIGFSRPAGRKSNIWESGISVAVLEYVSSLETDGKLAEGVEEIRYI